MNHELVLEGCTATVLASYLKALAVHRLVAEQLDPQARAWWDGDGRFHLDSTASWEGLVEFFVHAYKPTPIVTPWNGGSGFHPGDQLAGIAAIRASETTRFEPYRAAIEATERLLVLLGIVDKPEGDQKQRLLEHARSWLPDDVVPWLDAAYVVSETPGFSALLGTGGNDGRLEFANNFMQRLAELFLTPRKGRKREATVAERLDASLFARPRAGVHASVSFGQFSPARAGGANMGEGFDGDSRVNHWDYVLAIEGSLLFAGATVRRLESHGDRAAAFPFHVAMSAVGYGSAGRSDDDRGNARSELWLPLWSRPTSFTELVTLFSEGRLQVGRRRAHDGLDAARAVSSLGVDRGVDRFQRIGILKRNGLSFLATSQGTLAAGDVPGVELLEELHDHVSAVARAEASADVATALRALRAAMFEACQRPRAAPEVLACVGRLERALARSPKSRKMMRPLGALDPQWFALGDDGSAEFAVAASFASWPLLRSELEPVDAGRWKDTSKPAWSGGDPLRAIVDVALRRTARATDPLAALRGWSHLTDGGHLAAMLDGRFDRRRFEDLLFALAVVKPGERAPKRLALPRALARDATFWTLRAVTSPTALTDDDAPRGPRAGDLRAVVGAVKAGRVDLALDIATRRLRAIGRSPVAPVRAVGDRDLNALAAALLVPLPPRLEHDSLSHLLNAPAAAQTEGTTP